MKQINNTGLSKKHHFNQDGRSSFLTAPNGPSQQSVAREALQTANLTADEVTGVSVHRTGTGFSDPIELGAISGVFSDAMRTSEGVTLISSKSRLGHAEPAAVVVRCMAALYFLSSHTVPRISHLRTPNPHLEDFRSTRIQWNISRMGQGRCSQQQHRICDVSTFAFQGINARALLRSDPGRVMPSASVIWKTEKC